MTEPKKRAARKPAAKTRTKTRDAAAGGTTKAGAAATAKKRGAAAPERPQWDIVGVNDWGPDRHELGATIPAGGNSMLNETGGWRTFVPVIDVEKCTGCMLCYFYCPDASIIIEGGKAVGIDMEHCKGCGICAKECPADAIKMILEEKE